MPKFEMEVSACAEVSCVADKGYRRSCTDLVSGFLKYLFVVPVYGDDVSVVLYLDGVSRVVVPFCAYNRAVESGLDYRTFRGCDVYERMSCRVVSLGYDALERTEEVPSLDGKIAFVPACRNAELFLFLDLFPENGIRNEL